MTKLFFRSADLRAGGSKGTQVVDRRERNTGSWAGNLLRCLIQGKRCSSNDRNQDGGTDDLSCHAHYPTTLWPGLHRARACCSMSRMEKAQKSLTKEYAAGWVRRVVSKEQLAVS